MKINYSDSRVHGYRTTWSCAPIFYNYNCYLTGISLPRDCFLAGSRGRIFRRDLTLILLQQYDYYVFPLFYSRLLLQDPEDASLR